MFAFIDFFLLPFTRQFTTNLPFASTRKKISSSHARSTKVMMMMSLMGSATTAIYRDINAGFSFINLTSFVRCVVVVLSPIDYCVPSLFFHERNSFIHSHSCPPTFIIIIITTTNGQVSFSSFIN